ncbi:MAG: DUF1559 domain-containing protein [Thermoguttaceae bacterium]|nr:DUF1559 domain-containing protein [Thermoguttaceae bacterium]
MSIQLTCPQCGMALAVADQYAGQNISCTNCGARVAVSGLEGQPVYAEAGSAAVPQRKTNVWLIVVLILACSVVPLLCCGGFGIALLLPAVQAAREAARRAQCINNMKQIGLALHNYHDAYRCFPPAFIPDEDGRPMHSWRVLILPFLEEQPLYEQYRFDEPWDSPHNRALADLMPSIYRCPSDRIDDRVTTSYAMVVGPNAFSTGPGARRVDEFADGLSFTLAVVEMVGAGINWMEPRDWDTTGPDGPQSYHPGVFNVLHADGSVRSMAEQIDAEVLKALITLDGGEPPDHHMPRDLDW